MLPFKLVYHDGYDLQFGAHVFPSIKYKLIRRKLLEEGIAGPEDFLTPELATFAQMTLVHTPDWVSRLDAGRLSYHEIVQLETPYSRRMVEAFFLAAGGTILAARESLKTRIGFNVGGGFHHAFPSHGEGFCAINDVAVAIRTLQREGLIERALVIDCDVHQGNGTAVVFTGDATVFTVSLHQLNNYPTDKPPSTIDIHLRDGCGDEEYLEMLLGACDFACGGFQPDIVLYVAGSDPYVDDQLGGLSLSKDGLKRRDQFVFETAVRHHIPITATLAGGYANRIEDTVELHVNTVLAARDALAS